MGRRLASFQRSKGIRCYKAKRNISLKSKYFIRHSILSSKNKVVNYQEGLVTNVADDIEPEVETQQLQSFWPPCGAHLIKMAAGDDHNRVSTFNSYLEKTHFELCATMTESRMPNSTTLMSLTSLTREICLKEASNIKELSVSVSLLSARTSAGDGRGTQREVKPGGR